MFLFRQPHQMRPQERTLLQIEWHSCVRSGQFFHSLLLRFFSQHAQVAYR
ncbi:hypothetical protein JCM10914A_03090 [Paenibacillus sp. JCM 10914]